MEEPMILPMPGKANDIANGIANIIANGITNVIAIGIAIDITNETSWG
jgi:hypothetical protein